MGVFISGGRRAALVWMEILFRAGGAARGGMPGADRSNPATERTGGRYRRGIRRFRQPDSIWPARRGDIFVESHDVVRGYVHVYVHGFGGARPDNERRRRTIHP